jgi:hypothetical protein
MRIAITGGGGELGRTLIPFLIEQGHSTVSIDRVAPPPGPPSPQRPEFVVADTRDFGQFVASIRGCDALIHLAAHRSPLNMIDHVVYADNTVSSYNALSAAATLGIQRVCLASSINAIGGVFSRAPRYDYFPVDEQHPTYAEDAYSLSKWVLEQQADAFARRFEGMRIASLRFHSLVQQRQVAADMALRFGGWRAGICGPTHRSNRPAWRACWRSPPISAATRLFISWPAKQSCRNSRLILRASIIPKPRYAAIYPATRRSSTRARPSACLAGSIWNEIIVGFSLLVGRFLARLGEK